MERMFYVLGENYMTDNTAVSQTCYSGYYWNLLLFILVYVSDPWDICFTSRFRLFGFNFLVSQCAQRVPRHNDE